VFPQVKEPEELRYQKFFSLGLFFAPDPIFDPNERSTPGVIGEQVTYDKPGVIGDRPTRTENFEDNPRSLSPKNEDHIKPRKQINEPSFFVNNPYLSLYTREEDKRPSLQTNIKSSYSLFDS